MDKLKESVKSLEDKISKHERMIQQILITEDKTIHVTELSLKVSEILFKIFLCLRS